MTLPSFAVADYAALVERLLSTGWTTAPVSALPATGDRVAFVRHDVDLEAGRTYVDQVVRSLWLQHTGGVSHDERTRSSRMPKQGSLPST